MATACSSDSDPPPGGDGGVDGHVSEAGVDAGALPPTALETVVSRLILPKSGSDFAVDLDNDGVSDNHFGRILAALATANPTIDLQQQLETQMARGVLLLLLRLHATALDNASDARVAAFFGRDLDADPSNDFSGTNTFGLQQGSPTSLILRGRLTAGQLEVGPGPLTLPFPLGESSALVDAKNVRLTAKVSPNGFTEGVFSGAFSVDAMSTVLLPELAREIDRQYKTSATPQGKKFLEDNFDLDKNGTITEDELRNNPITGLLFQTADVDLDGDQQKESISFAIGFETVLCTIKE
ncbi:MAG: hypothetical protein KC503_25850 [Myxococcales bacterium]|nr:hypothetical protein [Myxococcales bacterium]